MYSRDKNFYTLYKQNTNKFKKYNDLFDSTYEVSLCTTTHKQYENYMILKCRSNGKMASDIDKCKHEVCFGFSEASDEWQEKTGLEYVVDDDVKLLKGGKVILIPDSIKELFIEYLNELIRKYVSDFCDIATNTNSKVILKVSVDELLERGKQEYINYLKEKNLERKAAVIFLKSKLCYSYFHDHHSTITKFTFLKIKETIESLKIKNIGIVYDTKM